MVTVACFFPGQAKYLSAPHRHFVFVSFCSVSHWKLVYWCIYDLFHILLSLWHPSPWNVCICTYLCTTWHSSIVSQ